MTHLRPRQRADGTAPRRPHSTRVARIVALAGIVWLFTAWTVTTPPAAGFDEDAHLIRALGAAAGQWTGQPANPTAAVNDFGANVRRTYRLQARFDQDATAACLAMVDRDPLAACLDDALSATPSGTVTYRTYVGTYPPFLYLPAGVAASLSSGRGAFWLGRAAVGLMCVVLLAGALRVSRHAALLAGAALALTPAVVFLASSVTTNGIEISAAVLMGATSLAIVRGRHDTSTWMWWATGGSVLALSRSLGPLFVALHLLTIPALLGVRGTVRLISSHRRRVLAAAFLLVASVAVSALWTLSVMPPPGGEIGESTDEVAASLATLPRVVAQAIAGLAWGDDRHLPAAVFAVAVAALVTALGLAIRVGDRRERTHLAAVAALTLAVTIGIDLFIGRPMSYAGMQGRYVLPYAVMLPLLAGHIVCRHRPSMRQRTIFVWAAVAMIVVNAVAWWGHARRYAVGLDGPIFFLEGPLWSPGVAWPLVTGAAAIGIAALAGAVAVAGRRWIER